MAALISVIVLTGMLSWATAEEATNPDTTNSERRRRMGGVSAGAKSGGMAAVAGLMGGNGHVFAASGQRGSVPRMDRRAIRSGPMNDLVQPRWDLAAQQHQIRLVDVTGVSASAGRTSGVPRNPVATRPFASRTSLRQGVTEGPDGPASGTIRNSQGHGAPRL